jgi:hypothetical protein
LTTLAPLYHHEGHRQSGVMANRDVDSLPTGGNHGRPGASAQAQFGPPAARSQELDVAQGKARQPSAQGLAEGFLGGEARR